MTRRIPGTNIEYSPISIEDLPYGLACQIFGQPIVDKYLAHKDDPPSEEVYEVTSVDEKTRTITLTRVAKP